MTRVLCLADRGKPPRSLSWLTRRNLQQASYQDARNGNGGEAADMKMRKVRHVFPRLESRLARSLVPKKAVCRVNCACRVPIFLSDYSQLSPTVALVRIRTDLSVTYGQDAPEYREAK